MLAVCHTHVRPMKIDWSVVVGGLVWSTLIYLVGGVSAILVHRKLRADVLKDAADQYKALADAQRDRLELLQREIDSLKSVNTMLQDQSKSKDKQIADIMALNLELQRIGQQYQQQIAQQGLRISDLERLQRSQ